MAKTNYAHILKYTGLFGGVQGLNIMIGLVRNKFVALILGPEGMGLISLFNSTVNLMSGATNLGIPTSGVKALSITTQIDGKELMFVTDATKLLNLFKSVGAKSSNSTIKTVTTLMKNVDGMLAGVTLEKK